MYQDEFLNHKLYVIVTVTFGLVEFQSLGILYCVHS